MTIPVLARPSLSGNPQCVRCGARCLGHPNDLDHLHERIGLSFDPDPEERASKLFQEACSRDPETSFAGAADLWWLLRRAEELVRLQRARLVELDPGAEPVRGSYPL